MVILIICQTFKANDVAAELENGPNGVFDIAAELSERSINSNMMGNLKACHIDSV